MKKTPPWRPSASQLVGPSELPGKPPRGGEASAPASEAVGRPGNSRAGAASLWMPELDGLRACAALAVMVVHYASQTIVTDIALAGLGVATFYGLSAFLITFLAFKEIARTGTFGVKRFLLRRVFRIWPLYFFVITVGFLLVGPYGPFYGTTSTELVDEEFLGKFAWPYPLFLTNLAYAFNYTKIGDYSFSWWAPSFLGVTWSVSLEEQMYLLFPVLLAAALRYPQGTLIGLVAAGFVSRIGFLFMPVWHTQLGVGGGMYYATATYFDLFALGGLAGWAHAADRVPRLFKWKPLGLLLLPCLLATGVVWHGVHWHPYAWYAPLVYLALAVQIPALILWLVRSEGGAVRLLASPPLLILGRLSYGLYLWHLLAIGILFAFIDGRTSSLGLSPQVNFWANFIVFVIITTLLSALSYGLVERPFLVLKSRMIGGKIQKVPWIAVMLFCILSLGFIHVTRLTGGILPQ